MKRTWTIIGVRDVPASFKWREPLFGHPPTPPATTTLGKSTIRMEPSCFACISRAFTNIRH
jgi:hypothetical protein